MHLIDGKKLAEKIRHEVKKEIETQGASPGLAVILVGDDPASHLYVRLKERACTDVGIRFEKFLFPASTQEKDILEKIAELNVREDIHGILVQLPLPEGLNEDRVIAAILPRKDVDGFHPENLRLLREGRPRLVPGVAKGILALVDATGMELRGKRAVLLVNSRTFAEPISDLLRARDAEPRVIIADEVPPSELATADIIIVALGRPGAIRAPMVKDGAVIIDVGTTRVGDRVVGDADFESFRDRDVWITPVPGGVGPMTVAMLLQNVMAAYKLSQK